MGGHRATCKPACSHILSSATIVISQSNAMCPAPGCRSLWPAAPAATVLCCSPPPSHVQWCLQGSLQGFLEDSPGGAAQSSQLATC